MNIESGGVVEKTPKVNTGASHIEDLVDEHEIPVVRSVENPKLIDERIKEIKRIIDENSDRRNRIEANERPYGALIDEDREVMDIPMDNLKQELSELTNKRQQQKKQQVPPWRKTLRKVAAFLNF